MSEGREKSVLPLPAIPQVVHEAVRIEIARMNTAICQATQNSPVKVSLTWRPNPQFAQQLSEKVLNCIDNEILAASPTCSFAAERTPMEKSIIGLEKYVTETIERLEGALAAFKAAAAETR